MMEKGKISAFQLGILMHPTIIATAILNVPASVAIYAGRDMWISPLWAFFVGILTIMIATRLGKMYPNESPIIYIQHILGKKLGLAVGLGLLLFLFHITSMMLRQYAEFVNTFLEETPMIIIIFCMVFVCSLAARAGIEVIGRVSQIFVPLVVMFIMVLFILLIHDLEVKNMLPIFDDGIVPSLKGSLIIMSWYSEFILIAFLYSYVSNQKKVMMWGVLSAVSVLIALMASNLIALLLFGDITANLTYPVMSAGRFISIGDFLEHLEAIVMAIWVTGVFLKITVFYYVITVGTAQCFKLKDYRAILLPLGFLLLLLSYWTTPSIQEFSKFLTTTAIPYFSLFLIALPMFLLAVAYMKKRYQKKRGVKN